MNIFLVTNSAALLEILFWHSNDPIHAGPPLFSCDQKVSTGETNNIHCAWLFYHLLFVAQEIEKWD